MSTFGLTGNPYRPWHNLSLEEVAISGNFNSPNLFPGEGEPFGNEDLKFIGRELVMMKILTETASEGIRRSGISLQAINNGDKELQLSLSEAWEWLQIHKNSLLERKIQRLYGSVPQPFLVASNLSDLITSESFINHSLLVLLEKYIRAKRLFAESQNKT